MDSANNKMIGQLGKTKKILVDSYYLLRGKILRRLGIKDYSDLNSEQTELDKKLIYSLTKSKIPNLRQIKYVGRFLSRGESRLIKISALVILFSLAFIGYNFYINHLQLVPNVGGEYTEGLVGTPKSLNPLYAGANEVDGDISRLVFSSLFNHNKNGELINDLAVNYSLSEDEKIYTIAIREDARWTNGEKITSDDIIFTFETINNAQYKSPLRNSFSGVNIEKVDEKTIKFILTQAYGGFLELLTFGIIPQNLWLSISPESAILAELNFKPVGSGPYKFKSLTKDKSGNIRTYSLTLNNDYYGAKPYIKDLTFKFFVSLEEAVRALNENLVDGISYLSANIKDEIVSKDALAFHQLSFPQIYAVFFNQKNNPALVDKKIRQALAFAINKSEITAKIFEEDAYAIDGPILPNNFAYNANGKKYKYNFVEAEKLLTEAGWTKTDITAEDIVKAETDKTSKDEKVKQEAEAKLMVGPGSWQKKDNKYLIINLTTVEKNSSLQTAEMIKSFWEKIGVKTNLNIIPLSEIQNKIIKPKNFETLFYGQFVGSDPDSYTFWHSSQVGEGGLNIANYANKDVDQLLEDARLIANKEQRAEKYKKFQDILSEEVPAIFMYSPFYTYIQSKNVKGFDVKIIYSPCDRFANISDWYVKTGKKIIW